METRRSVAAHDAVTGAPVRTIVSEPSAGLRGLDATTGGDGLWVAGTGGLRRYSAEGDLVLSVPMAGLLHVAAAPDGGAWAATAKELIRVGPAGERLLGLQPFAGRGVITDLAADPGDGAVRFTVDATPPAIRLDHPAGGQVTGDREQVFEGSLSEPASLTLNGAQVPLSGLAFRYGPVLLEEGENPFVLTATDPAGNTGELALTVTLQLCTERIASAGSSRRRRRRPAQRKAWLIHMILQAG